MTDPTLVLRGSQSGQIVRGTPTNKLTFDSTGERVGGVPSAAAGLTSFNGRTAPAVVPQAGDYNSHEVADSSTVGGPSVEDSLDTLNAEVATLSGAICAKSGTLTTGAFACAENLNTKATGDHSHAEGNGGESRGEASHTEGTNGLAVGVSSHVEGRGSRTDGDNSHAEGLTTTATGTNSHAEGNNCHSDGESSHAEGFNSVRLGVMPAGVQVFDVKAQLDRSRSRQVLDQDSYPLVVRAD